MKIGNLEISAAAGGASFRAVYRLAIKRLEIGL
jgi:hypothetical protein